MAPLLELPHLLSHYGITCIIMPPQVLRKTITTSISIISFHKKFVKNQKKKILIYIKVKNFGTLILKDLLHWF